MKKVIRVGMSDYQICQPPQCISTLGLGSCIGVVFYDTSTKICGMAHVMLPNSKAITGCENRKKFVDTCLEDMHRELLNLGANKRFLVAKMAGGARMFSYGTKSELFNIGEKNIRATREYCERIKIPIIAEDTGSTYGRTIEFDPESGELLIRAVGIGSSTI